MPTKPTAQPASKFYRAHVDWWVQVGALVLIVFFLVTVPYSLWASSPIWQRALIAGVSLIIVTSIVDKVYFTIYELGDESLSVHTQLRRLNIPYREMREIVPTGAKALFTTKRRKRFALSLHNLTVKINDPLWDEISVSPQHSHYFLEQLLAKIDQERSRRATVSRKK